MPRAMKPTSSNIVPLGKRKGVELAPQPARVKRSRQDRLRAKKSNRPTDAWSSDDSEEEEEEEEEAVEAEAEGESVTDEEEDPEAARARMLTALEAHQAAFLLDAAPTLVPGKGRADKGKAVAAKPIWEMDMDDFDDDDDDDQTDSEEEDQDEEALATSTTARRVPAVIAFAEPTVGAAGALGSHRDMRSFMNPRAKDALKKESVADLANAKHWGKARSAAPAAQLDAEQEAHLDSLDASLSALIRPLASTSQATGSALPELLRTLPTAPTKLHKGLAPLPSNVPRTLRKGQSAVNLARAQKRDAAAGVLAGAKVGREALSLKEKRKVDGDDERQRGQGGAVGKMVRGGLVLSKDDIRMGMGGGGGGFGGKGGGKKAGGSRKDGHGGLAAMRAKLSGGKGGKKRK